MGPTTLATPSGPTATIKVSPVSQVAAQAGFLDGLHGLVLCALQAFGVFLKYARLWEYRIRERRGEKIELPAFDDDAKTWQRPENGLAAD